MPTKCSICGWKTSKEWPDNMAALRKHRASAHPGVKSKKKAKVDMKDLGLVESHSHFCPICGKKY